MFPDLILIRRLNLEGEGCRRDFVLEFDCVLLWFMRIRGQAARSIRVHRRKGQALPSVHFGIVV